MDASGASSGTLSEKKVSRLTSSFLFYVSQHLLPYPLLSHEGYKHSNICHTNSYFLPLPLNDKTNSFQHGRCDGEAMGRTVATAEEIPGSCRDNLTLLSPRTGTLLTVCRPSSEREKFRATGPRNKHFGTDT
jgi:hypothetical protein